MCRLRDDAYRPPVRALPPLGAGGEPGGLCLLAGGPVRVDRADRRSPVDAAHELAMGARYLLAIAVGRGRLEPLVQRLRGRAVAQVLEPLAGGDVYAALLLLDVRHTETKGPAGRAKS